MKMEPNFEPHNTLIEIGTVQTVYIHMNPWASSAVGFKYLSLFLAEGFGITLTILLSYLLHWLGAGTYLQIRLPDYRPKVPKLPSDTRISMLIKHFSDTIRHWDWVPVSSKWERKKERAKLGSSLGSCAPPEHCLGYSIGRSSSGFAGHLSG